MKKITILFIAMIAFSLQSYAQSQIEITTSGGNYAGEKWVSITDAPDGAGTQVWGQGNGTQCDGAGLLDNEVVTLPAGTYYVNCYDQYDDGWDGTLISVTAYGSVIGDNGGVTPNDTFDTDLTTGCEGTAEELEASFMIVVPVAPCVAPAATFAVVEDCTNGFTVDINVTDLGDATSLDVQESGTSVGTIAATGITNVGPFTNGNAITLTLVHNVSTLCNIEETGLVNTLFCSTQVICGATSNATGCYESSDNLDWGFASSDGTSGLKITVNSGTVENTYDEFIIYDGVDATAPELYNGYGTAGDLTGLTFNSTGTSLFVRIAADGGNSCGSGQQTSIDFDVQCLSCTPATVTAAVVDDCAVSGGFNIEVDITDLGSATSMTVSDDQGSATQPATATGTLTFGPYVNGTDVTITVANDQDALCTSSYNGLVQDVCPATNDECANAIDLDSVMNADEVTCTLTYTGSNLGATNSAGEVAPSGTCTNAGTDPNPSDIWFTLTVPASGGFIYDNIVVPGVSSILEVYTGTCGALTALDPVACNSSGAEKTFEGLTPGSIVYLRYWDYGSDDEGALEFCIKPTPSCVAPSALTATDITDTSANLAWTENGSATTWNVEWGTAPLTMGAGTMITATMTNPQALTGLTGDTSYQYYVQADCGAGDTSAWSGPYSFNTLVPPPACGGNFYDTGGSTGNYASGESYTITICPDISGDAVSAAFTSFLVEGNAADACWDELLIYDGADNTGTPITPASLGLGIGTEGFCWQGAGDGTADLTGQTITSSDASGCLTFTFTSDGSAQFSGWEATIGCSPLSAQDIAFNDLFSYFPNPVNNNLTLTAQKDINNISVYNMLGQEVLRAAPNAMNTEVNMSDLQTGAYFVKVTIGNATETVRVIKN